MADADEANEVISLMGILSHRLMLPQNHLSKDIGTKKICSGLLEALMPARHASPVDETEYEFSIIRLELNTPHVVEKRIERAINLLTNVYHRVVLRIANELSDELRKRKARLVFDNQELPFADPRFTYKLEQYFQDKFDQVVEHLQLKIQNAVASLFQPQAKRLSKAEGDALLRRHYKNNTHPDGDTKWMLAKATNRTYEQIGTWFCNRRTRHGETIRRDHAAIQEATSTKAGTPEKYTSRGYSVAECNREREEISIPISGVDDQGRIEHYAEQYELSLDDENAIEDGFYGYHTDSDTEFLDIKDEPLSGSELLYTEPYAESDFPSSANGILPMTICETEIDECTLTESMAIEMPLPDLPEVFNFEESIHNGEAMGIMEDMFMSLPQLSHAIIDLVDTAAVLDDETRRFTGFNYMPPEFQQ